MVCTNGSHIKGLYALVDTTYHPQKDHLELAREFLKGGAQILQLRMKGEKDLDHIRQVACSIQELKADYDFTFIINDHVDLALEIVADGLHGGHDDISIQAARDRLGNDILIGYSAHSLPEVYQAFEQGADYVALGAIFPTSTKPLSHPVQGLETLQKAVELVDIPVVAIGGIDRSNLYQILETQVSAVAMIGGLTKATDVAKEVKWYCDAIHNFNHRGV
jgi:thiamine-phosphate pyrophosphorylase